MGKNIIDLSGGQINDPSSGKDFSLPFLPATSSSPSQTLAPHALLLLELRRYKDIVMCGVASYGDPRTPSKSTDRNLDCAICTLIVPTIGSPLGPLFMTPLNTNLPSPKKGQHFLAISLVPNRSGH